MSSRANQEICPFCKRPKGKENFVAHKDRCKLKFLAHNEEIKKAVEGNFKDKPPSGTTSK
jgi:hypothetical protein